MSSTPQQYIKMSDWISPVTCLGSLSFADSFPTPYAFEAETLPEERPVPKETNLVSRVDRFSS